MMKIMPFNLLLIFLVVVISGTSTTTIIDQDVLAQKSDGSSGLNFDINSLFGSGNEGFSFDEIFPFDQSSSSDSSNEESSDNGGSSNSDESAVTDPLVRKGGLIVTDNILSPEDYRPTMVEYVRHVRSKKEVRSVTVPIGYGEEISLKLA